MTTYSTIGTCALCGKQGYMEEHHYIPRARHQDTPKIPLHHNCHQDVHNLSNAQFLKKHKQKRIKFIKVKGFKEYYENKNKYWTLYNKKSIINNINEVKKNGIKIIK